jgi:hypothetical protein
MYSPILLWMNTAVRCTTSGRPRSGGTTTTSGSWSSTTCAARCSPPRRAPTTARSVVTHSLNDDGDAAFVAPKSQIFEPVQVTAVLHSCSGNRSTRSPRWARQERLLPPLPRRRRSPRTGSAGARSRGRRLPRPVAPAPADSTASARCRRRPPTLPSVPGNSTSSATMVAAKEGVLPPRRRGLPRLRGTTCPSATPASWR